MNAPGKNTAADYQAYADQGYSKFATARLMGVSHQAVSDMADRHGIEFISGRVNRDAEIIRMHSEGKSGTETATDLRCPLGSVFQAYRRLGITPNKLPRKSKWEAPVRALAAQGMTVNEVAAALGTYASTVSLIKADFAVPFTRDGRAA